MGLADVFRKGSFPRLIVSVTLQFFDAVTDIVVAAQFFSEGEMPLFYISIAILLFHTLTVLFYFITSKDPIGSILCVFQVHVLWMAYNSYFEEKEKRKAPKPEPAQPGEDGEDGEASQPLGWTDPRISLGPFPKPKEGDPPLEIFPKFETYRVFEGTLESVPQMVITVYYLIHKPAFDDGDTLKFVSVGFSIISVTAALTIWNATEVLPPFNRFFQRNKPSHAHFRIAVLLNNFANVVHRSILFAAAVDVMQMYTVVFLGFVLFSRVVISVIDKGWMAWWQLVAGSWIVTYDPNKFTVTHEFKLRDHALSSLEAFIMIALLCTESGRSKFNSDNEVNAIIIIALLFLLLRDYTFWIVAGAVRNYLEADRLQVEFEHYRIEEHDHIIRFPFESPREAGRKRVEVHAV